MANEEFLMQLILGTVHSLQLNIECLINLPENTQAPGFDDGKICGLTVAKNALLNSLKLYENWLKDELSK